MLHREPSREVQEIHRSERERDPRGLRGLRLAPTWGARWKALSRDRSATYVPTGVIVSQATEGPPDGQGDPLTLPHARTKDGAAPPGTPPADGDSGMADPTDQVTAG
jgi:hypothetical protein